MVALRMLTDSFSGDMEDSAESPYSADSPPFSIADRMAMINDLHKTTSSTTVVPELQTQVSELREEMKRTRDYLKDLESNLLDRERRLKVLKRQEKRSPISVK